MSGLALEYRIVQLYSRDPGRREAKVSFSVGQGSQDPGFRANLDSFLLQFNKKTNPPPSLLWNFEKFLINRNGQVVARFAPDTLPTDPVIIEAIERELQPS